MENFARFLLRLLLVPLGAAAAIVVTMAVLALAHWNECRALAEANPDADVTVLLLAGPIVAVLQTYWLFVTAPFTAVGVLIAEAFAIRSWMFHAANGGLSAWIGWSIMQDPQDQYRFLTDPKAMVAAGLAGGLAYWLVAGWTAGFWKPVFGPEPARV